MRIPKTDIYVAHHEIINESQHRFAMGCLGMTNSIGFFDEVMEKVDEDSAVVMYMNFQRHLTIPHNRRRENYN